MMLKIQIPLNIYSKYIQMMTYHVYYCKVALEYFVRQCKEKDYYVIQEIAIVVGFNRNVCNLI
jgi:hypothetical protein